MDPFGESGPDEPEEFDPDSLGPETPDVEPDLEESFANLEEVDDDLFRAFWATAFFLNVAVAALAVGAMLLYFRGDWRNGGAAIAVGAVAAVFTARYYFGYTRGDDERGDHDDADRQGGDR